MTKFIRACQRGDIVAAQALIGRFPLHQKSHKGYTALDEAVKGGHEAVVRLLVGHGAPLHKSLTVAMDHNRADLVRVLIELGADVHTMNAACITPLTYAVLRGRADILELLMTRGISPETCLSSCIRMLNDLSWVVSGQTKQATMNYIQATCLKLLPMATSVNKLYGRQTPLEHAVHTRNEEIMAHLLKRGAYGVLPASHFESVPLEHATTTIDEHCVICLSSYSQAPVQVEACGHIFCGQCLQQAVSADRRQCCAPGCHENLDHLRLMSGQDISDHLHMKQKVEKHQKREDETIAYLRQELDMLESLPEKNDTVIKTIENTKKRKREIEERGRVERSQIRARY